MQQVTYFEVFNKFLAGNLSAINFLHDEVTGSEQRRNELLNKRLKVFVDV